MAQQREQTKRNKQLMVGNFKGMETLIDSSALGLDVADMALNVSWDTDGGISRREGSTTFLDIDIEVKYFIKKKVGIINADTLEISDVIRDEASTELQTAPNGRLTKNAIKVKGANSHTMCYLQSNNGTEEVKSIGVGQTVTQLVDVNGKQVSTKGTIMSSHVENLEGFMHLSVSNDDGTFSSLNIDDDYRVYNSNNLIGSHSSSSYFDKTTSPILQEQINAYDRDEADILWTGVEPKANKTDKEKVWVVSRNRKKEGSQGSEEVYLYQNYNNKSTLMGTNRLNEQGEVTSLSDQFGFVSAFRFVTMTDTAGNAHRRLFFLQSQGDVGPHKLMYIDENGQLEEFIADDKKRIISYDINDSGKLAMYLFDSNDAKHKIMYVDNVFDYTKNPTLTEETNYTVDGSVKNIVTLLDEYDGAPDYKTIIVSFKKGADRPFILSIVDNAFSHGDHDQTHDRYALADSHEMFAFDGTKWIETKNATNIISCKNRGINRVESRYPKVYYDDFKDAYHIYANSEYSFVNDYCNTVLEFDHPTRIWSVATRTNLGKQFHYCFLDENKEPISVNGNIWNHAVTDLSGSGQTFHTLIGNKYVKYIAVKESIDLLDELVITPIAELSPLDVKINNIMKRGAKVVGETKDITVAVYSNEGTIAVYDESKQPIPIVGKGLKTQTFNIGNVKTEDLDWTYINDSIILSTPKDAFVITIAKDKSGLYVAYINSIFKMADKITYAQAVESGLNRLSDDPLKIIKEAAELQGDFDSFEDIIITEPGNDNIVLSVAPNKAYKVHPQIIKTDGQSFDYAWKLFKLGKDDAVWTEVSSSLANATAEIPTINALNTSTEYRLECKATSKVSSSIILERSVTFFVDGKSNSLHHKTVSVAEEIKNCKYVTTIEGRLVFYGNGTRQIYTSEINSPFYFTASEIITADAFGKSEPVVSINTFKDTQIIFTPSSMMSMTRVYPEKGESFWSVLPLDGVVGAVEHAAVTPIENSLAFVSDEGIYIIGQVSVAEKRVQLVQLSRAIQDIASVFQNGSRAIGINVANVEKRLFISYPSKKQILVYDYNTAENIAQGKWAIWTGIVPKQMIIDDSYLYFIDKNSSKPDIYKKNKRIYEDIHELSGDDEFYFTDSKEVYPFIYKSKNSALGAPMVYKKIKRVSVTTDNYINDDAKFYLLTEVDYQRDWEENINTDLYKRANLNKAGFLKLGKTMTTWRKSENIKTITKMKSKNGTVVNIEIINDSGEPFSIKRIYAEYMLSNIRRFKSNSK